MRHQSYFLMASHVNIGSLLRSRELALASLKSGSRNAALKHAREVKLASESREKCTSLLNRVEEVLRAIADAESSKKVG